MKKFNEWMKERNSMEENIADYTISEQLKDAIKDGQEWKCPHCTKPLTENELKNSVCSGCWNKIMNRNLTWYGLGKSTNQYSPSTMPLGSRTWGRPTDWDYREPINPGDANRIGGI